ncbi:HK97 gp10 family phage protein [Paracoccus cavernae]|uniref:HK97 gp10 family phage protein n=1 Tax=Paracoccus cavernae TaxID=1571207 RepID=A0ABT8DBT2_9RHOB|nr:HK97 gp10 family phage protein [Paracoccus cavernae]
MVAKLKQIPAVAVDAARLAMEEGAEEICEYMRNLIRSNFKPGDGDLLRSVGWTWGEVPAGSFMIDEIRSGKTKGDQYATLRIKIYAGNRDAFYARFHEFGTKTGLPARPFFFPAWKAKRADFRKKIRNRVRAAIREAWRNG